MGIDNQACNSFATSFGRFLARSVSDASSADWQISVAETQPDVLPASVAPVTFRLCFEEAVEGVCHVVFEEGDLAGLSGRTDASAEEGTAALLMMMRTVAAELEEQLGSAYGAVKIAADLAPEFYGEAARSLELRARDGEGAEANLFLYFDEALVASFATLAAVVTSSLGELNQKNLDLVMDVELNVTLRFGQRQLTLREILDLASGSVVELDRQVEEPVELILDGKIIARGEAVIIDGNYGMRVTQVLHPVVY
jgi:flagellar motor switch protein FliN/FliY